MPTTSIPSLLGPPRPICITIGYPKVKIKLQQLGLYLVSPPCVNTWTLGPTPPFHIFHRSISSTVSHLCFTPSMQNWAQVAQFVLRCTTSSPLREHTNMWTHPSFLCHLLLYWTLLHLRSPLFGTQHTKLSLSGLVYAEVSHLISSLWMHEHMHLLCLFTLSTTPLEPLLHSPTFVLHPAHKTEPQQWGLCWGAPLALLFANARMHQSLNID